MELKYASKRRKQIIPLVLDNESFMNRVAWLEPILGKLLRIDLRDTSESKFRLKTRELLHRINDHATISQQAQLHSIGPPTYLWELIKYEYMRNSSIERFINPAKSFPIEQSYINLAIVKSKEHQDQEKELRTAVNRDAIIDTYEDIYGSKTSIEIKDIFESCRDSKRQVLVFGRAGIGKSTFCRYIAHQWATGKILREYDLVALIPLRSLTNDRYPRLDTPYSPIDIVIAQCLQDFNLSGKDKELFEQQFSNVRILWLLDGYDERVQNGPSHLNDLFRKLLKTTDHIITSRPYQNTLSLQVQMEITGFTDQNIHNYAGQFFDEVHNGPRQGSTDTDNLIRFLQSNQRLWGIAHIPINLELICSVWSNHDWSEIKTMTSTMLYDKLVEWMCRRYLEKHHGFSSGKLKGVRKKELYKQCNMELQFLERLAFLGMVKNTIILRPKLLEQAEDESGCSTADHPNLLNIGILKSFPQTGTGTQIEVDKDHYFVHLSFQEYFAARYLVNDFKRNNGEEAIEFIKEHKYQQRLRYVLTFTSGLLTDDGDAKCMDVFWDTIMGHPIDLVGIQHMNLMLACFDETGCTAIKNHQQQLISIITQLLEQAFNMQHENLRSPLLRSLESCNAILHHHSIQQTLANLLTSAPQPAILDILSLINTIKLANPLPALEVAIVTLLGRRDERVKRDAMDSLITISERTKIPALINRLLTSLRKNENPRVRRHACEALGKMREKAATPEVIDQLVKALDDKNDRVRMNACETLAKMGEKAATPEVIARLVKALDDKNGRVRMIACETLGKMGEKVAAPALIDRLVTAPTEGEGEALGTMGERAATFVVIDRFGTAVGDEKDEVKSSASDALGKVDEKAATPDVIDQLVKALGDDKDEGRSSACEALGKMGEKAATSEVIDQLVKALGDNKDEVRSSACEALGKMGEKAATPYVIDRLVKALGDKYARVRKLVYHILRKMGKKAAAPAVINGLLPALDDENDQVRLYAWEILGQMGKKAAVCEVVERLVTALNDKDEAVRSSVYNALLRMGEKAAAPEVIDMLSTRLNDENPRVRLHACLALGKMGAKAATPEVINPLVRALDDKNKNVRRNACEALGLISETVAGSDETVRCGAAESELYGVKRFKRNEYSSNRLETSTGGAALYSPVCEEHAGGIDFVWTGLDEWSASEYTLRAFSRIHNSSWLLACIGVLLFEESACYFVGEKVVIVCRQKSVQIRIRDKEIRENLRAALGEQKNKLFGQNHIDWKSSEQEKSSTKESMIVD